MRVYFLLLAPLLLTAAVKETNAQTTQPGSISSRLAAFKNNTSVDMATGIMNYNIPLFTISQDGFQLPMTLSYTGQGIKCDEIPGLSGLGWTLSFGGCSITRTMRGSAADEDIVYGILDYPIPTDSTSRISHTESVNSSLVDGESDIFTLNLRGNTVKFVLQKSGTQFIAHPLYKTDVSIQCNYSSFTINGWTIIDGDGNTYQLTASRPSEVYTRNNTPKTSYLQPVITSWYVTSIKPYNSDIITFQYEPYDYVDIWRSVSGTLMTYTPAMSVPNINNPTLIAQLNSLPPATNPSAQIASLKAQLYYANQNYNNEKQMARDQSSVNSASLNALNSDIVQDYSNDIASLTQQLATYQGQTSYGISTAANSILAQMYAQTSKSQDSSSSGQSNAFVNKLLKRIIYRGGEVDFSYKLLADSCFVYSRIEQRDLSDNRLSSCLFDVSGIGYLRSVQLLNKADQIRNAYQFTYYDQDSAQFCNSTFMQYPRDYWGYYNGKTSNTTLLPSDPIYYFAGTGTSYISVFSIMGNGGGSANRKPDTAWTKARSLQSIVSESGAKITFKYEANEVYNEDLDTNIIVGGLRIKSITVNDGLKDEVTNYRYKFPLLSNPGRQKSTGRLNEWQKQSFGWSYRFTGYGVNGMDYYSYSNPIYLGTLVDDNSNNGVLYHYVEVVQPDSSTIGYKYPEVYPVFYGNWDVTQYPFPHNSQLDRALLATVYYDKSGKIVRADRNSYAYPTRLLGNRSQEFQLLQNSYKYFTDSGSVQPDSVAQTKAEPIHYNQAALLTAYPNSIDPNTKVTCNYYTFSINPYNQIYQPNYPQRLVHTSNAINYNLPLDAALLKRETQQISFGDYNTAQAYDSSNYPGLPNERAYLYERLINYANAPRVTRTSDYTYNSMSYPVTTKTVDSKNNIYITRKKYAIDYQLAASDPISLRQQQHCYTSVIESQSWVSQDNGNSFRLTGASLEDYAITDSGSTAYSFPVTTYKLNVSQPANVSFYSESPFTLPPYTTVHWDNNNLYKVETNTHWSVLNAFTRMDQSSDRFNYKTQVIKYSQYTGSSIFSCTNCTYNGVIATDQSPFLTHSYYANAYGKFASKPAGLYMAGAYTYQYITTHQSYTQLFVPPIDISSLNNVQIATAALAELQGFQSNTTAYPKVANLPIFIDIVKGLAVIATQEPVDSFAKYIVQLNYDMTKDMTTGGYAQITTLQTYAAGYGIHIAFMEAYLGNIYKAFRSSLSAYPGYFDFTLYDNLFITRRNLLDYVYLDPLTSTPQTKTYSMTVNAAALANRYINMFVVDSVNDQVSVTAVYSNGTTSSAQTITFSGAARVKQQMVDLQSFANYQSIQSLQFNFSCYPLTNNLYYFCAAPSNVQFSATAYLPDGKPYIQFDQNGQYTETFYNSFGQKYWVRNFQNQVISVDTVLNANNSIPLVKMLKINLTNMIPDASNGVTPKIVSLGFWDLTNGIILPLQMANVLPSEEMAIEVPAVKYQITIYTDPGTYTLAINGATVSTSATQTIYNFDATNATTLNISIHQ